MTLMGQVGGRERTGGEMGQSMQEHARVYVYALANIPDRRGF